MELGSIIPEWFISSGSETNPNLVTMLLFSTLSLPPFLDDSLGIFKIILEFVEGPQEVPEPIYYEKDEDRHGKGE